MRRELSPDEIIRAGRASETHHKWEPACAFARALYGPTAARMTYSQTTFPEQDHQLRTILALVFDAAGEMIPYDFTTSWWAAHSLPDDTQASAWELTRSDLTRGLGSSLPGHLRGDLRAFAEDSLGIETLHTWLGDDESETLTWTFDLLTPPPCPYINLFDNVGAPLSPSDLIVAGVERERHVHWERAATYVHALYGGRAARVDVIAFSRYNDNTYDHDIRLDVFDVNDQRLFYDLRLPWWERFALTEQDIAQYAKEHDPLAPVDDDYEAAYGSATANAESDIQRLAMELLGAEFGQTNDPWASDRATYDLTQPPALRFSHVWIDDGV